MVFVQVFVGFQGAKHVLSCQRRNFSKLSFVQAILRAILRLQKKSTATKIMRVSFNKTCFDFNAALYSTNALLKHLPLGEYSAGNPQS